MKFTDLFEQTIGYTPERIDELIQESTAFYVKAKKYYEKHYNIVLILTIQDCMNDYENLNTRLKELQDARKSVEGRYGKYYDIVNSHSLGEYPENVSDLEKIADALDELSMNISDVAEALDHLLDSAKYLSRNKH